MPGSSYIGEWVEDSGGIRRVFPKQRKLEEVMISTN